MNGDRFEHDVRVALRDAVPPVPQTPALAWRAERLARARRRRFRLTAAGVLVVAGLTGAGVVVAGTGEGGPARDSRAASQAPPATDTTRPYLVVVPSTLPPQGGRVALVAANPTPEPLLYGLAGTVEQWTGERWRAYSVFAAGPAEGNTGGRLGTDVVRAVGYTAGPKGYGELEWLDVGPLPPGFYRLSQGSAVGVLAVDEYASPSTVPVVAAPSWLSLGPVPDAGRAGRFTVTVSAREGYDRADIAGPMTIERLDGHAPGIITTVDAPPVTTQDTFQVDLPALDAGSYRITRYGGAGAIQGVFLVLPPIA